MGFGKWLLYCSHFFLSTICMGMEDKKNGLSCFTMPCIIQKAGKQKQQNSLVVVPYDKHKEPITFLKNEVRDSFVLHCCFNQSIVDEDNDKKFIELPISIENLPYLQVIIKDLSQKDASERSRLIEEWQIILKDRFACSKKRDKKSKYFKETQQNILTFLKDSNYLSCQTLEKIFSKLLARVIEGNILNKNLSEISALLKVYKDVLPEISCKVSWELLNNRGVITEIRNRKNYYLSPIDECPVDLFVGNANGSLALLHERSSLEAFLVNLKTKKVKRFYEHDKEVIALNCAPKGGLCATSDGEKIFIWSINRDDSKHALLVRLADEDTSKPFKEKVSVLLFNHDSSFLVSGHDNGVITFWDLFLHEKNKTVTNSSASITALCFHPVAENLLMVGDANGEIKLLNINNINDKYVSKTRYLKSGITMISYQEQGELVAIGTQNNGTRILDAATFDDYKCLEQSDGWAGVACFGPGHCVAVATTEDCHLEIINFKKNKLVRSIEFSSKPIVAITFDKQRKKCIAVSEEGGINICDLNKDELEKELRYCTIEQAILIIFAHNAANSKQHFDFSKDSPLREYYNSLPIILRNYIDSMQHDN